MTVREATGYDSRKGGQVHVDVQGKPMEGHTSFDPDPDGRNLCILFIEPYPHSWLLVDSIALNPPRSERVDEYSFEQSYVLSWS